MASTTDTSNSTPLKNDKGIMYYLKRRLQLCYPCYFALLFLESLLCIL
jgi:hypothetical protein